MEIEIKQIVYGSFDHQNMIILRDEILRKPLGIHFDISISNDKKEDILIGGFIDVCIVGCCILTKINNITLKLRQMAVTKAIQEKGIGKKVVQYAEKTAKEHNYKKIMMHARSTAINFYKKLGYSIIGDEFFEIGIPHYIMEKKI